MLGPRAPWGVRTGSRWSSRAPQGTEGPPCLPPLVPSVTSSHRAGLGPSLRVLPGGLCSSACVPHIWERKWLFSLPALGHQGTFGRRLPHPGDHSRVWASRSALRQHHEMKSSTEAPGPWRSARGRPQGASLVGSALCAPPQLRGSLGSSRVSRARGRPRLESVQAWPARVQGSPTEFCTHGCCLCRWGSAPQ